MIDPQPEIKSQKKTRSYVATLGGDLVANGNVSEKESARIQEFRKMLSAEAF